MNTIAENCIQINSLTVAVSDPGFQTGYDIGYRQYTDLYQGKTLKDLDLLDILLSNLAGVAHTATHKIGVITGWYAAMFTYDQHKGEVQHE